MTSALINKRLEAEKLIHQQAPSHLQDQLIALLRPAIELRAAQVADSQIPLGASKFGGAPDVPAEFAWPSRDGEPLRFLAQINLRDIALFDTQNVLPEAGLLSFFYDAERKPWGSSQEKNGWRVLWHTLPLERRSSVNVSEFCASMSCELQFTLPTDFECFPELGLTVEDCIRTGDWTLLDQLPKQIVPLQNQMLGHPNVVQRNPGVEVEASWRDFQSGGYSTDTSPLEPEAIKWILLLQLSSDSEVSTLWGDMGTLYFMIHPEDLAARNFDNVWLTLQCT